MREGNQCKAIYFATEDMIYSAKVYCWIIHLDGTYKLLKNKLTVMVFLAVDSNGNSEIIEIGLIAQEDKGVLFWHS